MPVKTKSDPAKAVTGQASAPRPRPPKAAPPPGAPTLIAETEPVHWSMVFLFARIFYQVRQRTEDVLGPHGMTPMQFTILTTLNRWAGMSSADLSRRFNVTPQTMGEMISNLERRGFLVRTPDQANRRALRLSLTDEGLRMLDVCNAAMDGLEAALLEAMPPDEVQALKRQLRLLHNHLGLVDEITDGAGSVD